MEKWLTEPRGYTSKQRAQKWQSERQINLGREQIRRILKKKLAMEKNKKKTTINNQQKVERSEKNRLRDTH